LAALHLNYETVEPYPLIIEAKGPLSDSDYLVEKMKFAKKGDKTSVIYNGKITLRGIPEAAWDYGQRQGCAGLGDGAPGRQNRQSQRHRQ
jgi:predicted helicase